MSSRAVSGQRLLASVVTMLVMLAISSWPAATAWASAADSAWVDHLGSIQSAPGFPAPDDDPDNRVYDKAEILTEAQEEALENDLRRAQRLGIAMLVYTRMSDDSPEESQAFADQLRTDWGVASEPGADDGLVYLLTVNPADPETNAVIVSAGANALPIRQLDGAAMQRIVETEMMPDVDEGQFNQGLLFGVRRVLNHAEYSPPSPPPLSSLQERLNTTANILGAGLLQLAVAGYFLVPVVRERRLTLSPSTGSLAIYAVGIGVLAVGVGVVAIAGHSTFGSLVALGVVVWAGCGVPLQCGFLERRKERSSTVRVRRHAVHAAAETTRPATPHAMGRLNG